MKHALFFIVVTAYLLPISSQGADLFWLNLRMKHKYKDAVTDCRGYSHGGDLFLSAEHENGVLSRVAIANHPYTWPYKAIYRSIELSPQELASTKLYRDKKGRYWLKESSWEQRTLMWAMKWGAEFNGHCKLPQSLQSISPSQVNLVFEVDGLEDGIWISDSPSHRYSGTRADGLSFQADMQIIQREYRSHH